MSYFLKTRGLFSVRLVVLLSFFIPPIAHALETGIDVTAETAGLKTVNVASKQIPEVVGTILGAVLALLGVVALVMVIYGGFLWMTAGGNDEQVKKSKGILFNSIIGLAIVVSAYVLVNYVLTSLIAAV